MKLLPTKNPDIPSEADNRKSWKYYARRNEYFRLLLPTRKPHENLRDIHTPVLKLKLWPAHRRHYAMHLYWDRVSIWGGEEAFAAPSLVCWGSPHDYVPQIKKKLKMRYWLKTKVKVYQSTTPRHCRYTWYIFCIPKWMWLLYCTLLIRKNVMHWKCKCLWKSYPGKWQAMHDANACENCRATIPWRQSPCSW